MAETTDELMNEIKERLSAIEARLPRQMDILAVSPRSKLPFKALSYRETLIWRMAELSQSAYEEFASERLASAIILTRGALETCAALWYLKTRVSAAVKAGSTGDIDSYLTRLFGGNRIDKDMRQAINMLNFVDSLEKDLEGFRHQYDILSEYAHANWSVTTGLYSRIDQEAFSVAFGSNPRNLPSPKHVGVINLSVALGLFEHTYNALGEENAAFVRVCEEATDKTPRSE